MATFVSFGVAEATFALIERTARREGWLGNLLAEGVKQAAAEVGQGSEKWAVHVKGMEQSAYDTHSATSMLLAYMTADVGAHHNRAWAITYDMAEGRDKVSPEKAAKVIEQGFAQALNLSLEPGELTTQELADVERIRAEKYANDEWTFKK